MNFYLLSFLLFLELTMFYQQHVNIIRSYTLDMSHSLSILIYKFGMQIAQTRIMSPRKRGGTLPRNLEAAPG
jgi:hypothetical protein